jgi:hypothetical protein
MLTSKEYNFDILFEKLDEAKKDSENLPNYIEVDILKQVDSDIESLREHIEAINETQYQTYSRS